MIQIGNMWTYLLPLQHMQCIFPPVVCNKFVVLVVVVSKPAICVYPCKLSLMDVDNGSNLELNQIIDTLTVQAFSINEMFGFTGDQINYGNCVKMRLAKH